MVDSVTREYCGLSVIHPDWNRDHEGTARVPEPFVNVLTEVQALGDLVELGQGRQEHGVSNSDLSVIRTLSIDNLDTWCRLRLKWSPTKRVG